MKPLFSLLIAGAISLMSSAIAQDAKPEAPKPETAEPSEPAKPAEIKPAAPLASVDLLRDKEVVDLFASLPVQEMGRIKPLDTVARFKLLRFSGKQSGISATRVDEAKGAVPIDDPATGKPLVDEKGKKVKFTAMEWLLVSWFRPDIAKQLPVFVVDNSEAVTELGLKAKAKRDRYTYAEIEPGRQSLMQKMTEIRSIDQKQRTPVQRALGKLAFDFLDYEMMLSHFDFARAPFGAAVTSLPPELASLVKDGKTDWTAMLPKMGEYLKAHPEAAAPMSNPWLREYYRTLVGALMSGNEETLPRFFPPPVEKIEVWHSPGTILKSVLDGTTPTAEDLTDLNLYGGLVTATTDATAFKGQAKKLHDRVATRAKERNQAGHVGMELRYHEFDYFYKALLCFVFGLLLLSLSWVKPAVGWGRFCKAACVWLTVAGTAFGTVGIVIRCLIMERPPITSLYETIIFITTTAAMLALIAEWITKKGWALAVASIAGTAGMFLSIRFMNMEGRDTMEQLQAVLITNFWLSTHVPCINLGYTAGMVSAIFSVIYILMRVFGKITTGDSTAKDLTRMSYAFVMAGLFLSLVGTVLGGIWANYSWGRFWGWDPKENGALMIVLVNLAILHARLGGYIREIGFHCCGIFLGMVVAFSWFATNQLGVGLHAYGAMEGAWMWLYIFWATMLFLLIVGLVVAMLDKKKPHSGSPDLAAAEPAV